MNRNEFELRYFFNAGYDARTNECDLEGTDVYLNSHYVGSIHWVVPDDIEGMSDNEFFGLLDDNGIIY